MSKFQAHSTRVAAATKAAMYMVTVEDIMRTADWSSEFSRSFIINHVIQWSLEPLYWQLRLQNHMLI